MSDIGVLNNMMTQAPQPQFQPTAELSSRRTGSQTLKREDSSSLESKRAFSDLVQDHPPAVTDKKSETSDESLSPDEKNSNKKFAGDDNLKPISLDRSRRAPAEADSQDESPSALDIKGEKSKKTEKQAPENKKTKALKDFMAQMQQHFGIKPEEILQAFSKLSAQELMSSPQDVSDQIMKNLNLSDDQKPLAALMYQQMIALTSEVKAQPLATSSGATATLPLQNQKDVASGFVPHASDAETEKAGAAAKAELSAKLQALNSAGSSNDATVPDAKLTALQKLVQDLKQAAPDADSKQLAALLQKMQAAATGGAADKSTSSDSADARLSALASMMGAAAATVQGSAKADGTPVQANQVASNTDAAASMMPTLTALMGQFAGGGGASAGGGESGGSGKGQKEMKALDALKGASMSNKADAGDVFAALTQQAAAGSTAASVAGLGSGANASQTGQPISAGDLASTINEIISKSQTLIKKGGGEMKVEMKSEGLGALNMKVAVQNGQVSVQMVTQNDKAKRAIEDNMHELKAALTAHKLDVGDIKVALSEGAHKHQDHAGDSSGREQAREAASQFLGNMHDERQENRGGMFDQPGWRSYRQDPLNRPSLGPAKDVAVAAMNNLHQTRSMGRAGNSGRLNVVA